MIRILIADDHPMVRRGLREALEDELDDARFGEAENGQQAIDHVKQASWDLALLDISMEGRGGLDVLAEIRELQPALPVLMLSMHPESDFAVRALKLGASGYVSKQSPPADLITAIRKVLAGGRYVSAALAERLAAEVGRDVNKLPHESLSDREMQVLRMVATGKSLKEIAADLSLSVKTIGTYHLRIFEKLDLRSDVDLTRYALTHRLVE